MSIASWANWRRLGRDPRQGSKPRKPKSRTSLSVEMVERRELLTVFTVINTNDSGAGSLRQAITDANAAGADTINFNIPGAGPHLIQPLTPLPPITDNNTFVDGYSQPGSSPNTLDVGDNANIRVQIDGKLVPLATGSSGLVLNSSNNVVRGLSVTGFCADTANRFGIVVAANGKTVQNNHIYGNFIGLNADGSTTDPIRDINGNVTFPGSGNTNGVGIRDSLPNGIYPQLSGSPGTATNNIIGRDVNHAPDPGFNAFSERNLIAGANDRPAISSGAQISGSTAFNNTIAGNYLGTDRSGNQSGPNLFNIYGIRVQLGAHDNLIGSNAAPSIETRNVVGGMANPLPNGSDAGILLFDNGTNRNRIIGNYVGQQADGGIGGLSFTNVGISVNARSSNVDPGTAISDTLILNNNIVNCSGFGVLVLGRNTSRTMIDTNLITNNGQGVVLTLSTNQNTIINNQIIGNFGNGVSVGEVGPTPGQADGANRITQNVIFNNGQLGIDLIAPGEPGGVVTPNDPQDADQSGVGGANFLTNFPVLTTAVNDGSSVTITGMLNGRPNTTYRIEFFANDAADPSGNGEGQRILGFTNATTDGAGNAQVTGPVFPSGLAPVGSFITAVAINETPGPEQNSTSEFSGAIRVQRRVFVTIDDAIVREADDGGTSILTFTVSVNTPLHQGFQVNFDSPDLAGAPPTNYGFATNSVDFLEPGGTLHFQAGETRKELQVPIVGDHIPELDELLRLVLRDPTSDTGNDQIVLVEDFANPVPAPTITGQGLILDNDASFTVSDANTLEGGNLSFVVTLNGPITRSTTVRFSTSDGSAHAGQDYVIATPGTLAFNPGDPTTQTVTVSTTQDTLPEGAENLFLNLFDPRYGTTLPPLPAGFANPPTVPVVGAKIDKAQGLGTILDDDSPLANISINDLVVNENAGNAVFTVTLSQASANPITLNFQTSNGSANSGQDYQASVGTLTIPANTTTAMITIPLIDDAIPEQDEDFFVNLSLQSGNALITDNQGKATIRDNDGDNTICVIIEQADTQVQEPLEGQPVTANFRVRLVTATGQPTRSDKIIQVNYRSGLTGDTARADLDYQSVGGTLVFQPGENVKVVSVPILRDKTAEATETFRVQLLDAINAKILSTGNGNPPGSATGTILDNPQNSDPTQVTDVQRLGFHYDPVQIVIKFSGPVSRASAENVNNYHLAQPGKDKKLGTFDDVTIRIGSASLQSDGCTVILGVAGVVPVAQPTLLAVNGTKPNGITDLGGNLIDGDKNGKPGGTLEFVIGKGKGLRDLRRGAPLGQAPQTNKPFGQPPKVQSPKFTTTAKPVNRIIGQVPRS